jgi:hypothetical protein
VKLSGSAVQLVAGGGRETLLDAIRSDPAAHGWQRVTDGAPCAFCAMIASQGIVAKDEDSAGFEAHGHCGCTAEPAFEGSPVNPTNARLREAWDEATAGSEARTRSMRSAPTWPASSTTPPTARDGQEDTPRWRTTRRSEKDDGATPDELGDAGKRALEAERKARRTAEKLG